MLLWRYWLTDWLHILRCPCVRVSYRLPHEDDNGTQGTSHYGDLRRHLPGSGWRVHAVLNSPYSYSRRTPWSVASTVATNSTQTSTWPSASAMAWPPATLYFNNYTYYICGPVDLYFVQKCLLIKNIQAPSLPSSVKPQKFTLMAWPPARSSLFHFILSSSWISAIDHNFGSGIG